jgi:hypothetical protein
MADRKGFPLPPDQQSSLADALVTGYPQKQPSLFTPLPAQSVQSTLGPYRTTLSPLEEIQFQNWVKTNRIPFDNSPTSDYDMRGFYRAAISGDPNAQTARSPFDGLMHFPDTWKTPYHKTFSKESQYALPSAPAWSGDRLINKAGGVVADERTPKIKSQDQFLSDMQNWKPGSK